MAVAVACALHGSLKSVQHAAGDQLPRQPGAAAAGLVRGRRAAGLPQQHERLGVRQPAAVSHAAARLPGCGAGRSLPAGALMLPPRIQVTLQPKRCGSDARSVGKAANGPVKAPVPVVLSCCGVLPLGPSVSVSPLFASIGCFWREALSPAQVMLLNGGGTRELCMGQAAAQSDPRGVWQGQVKDVRLGCVGSAQELRMEDCSSEAVEPALPWEDAMRAMPPLLELVDMFNIVARRCRARAHDADLLKGAHTCVRAGLLLLAHVLLYSVSQPTVMWRTKQSSMHHTMPQCRRLTLSALNTCSLRHDARTQGLLQEWAVCGMPC